MQKIGRASYQNAGPNLSVLICRAIRQVALWGRQLLYDAVGHTVDARMT